MLYIKLSKTHFLPPPCPPRFKNLCCSPGSPLISFSLGAHTEKSKLHPPESHIVPCPSLRLPTRPPPPTINSLPTLVCILITPVCSFQHHTSSTRELICCQPVARPRPLLRLSRPKSHCSEPVSPPSLPMPIQLRTYTKRHSASS
jgi:hypothetical protein